jgi:hypothetical protein
MSLEPPPVWIRRWSRGQRLAFAWTAVVLTVLVGVPAAGTGLFLVFGFEKCATVSCSQGYRFLVAIATIVILLPGVVLWMRYLQRIVSYRDPSDSDY